MHMERSSIADRVRVETEIFLLVGRKIALTSIAIEIIHASSVKGNMVTLPLLELRSCTEY